MKFNKVVIIGMGLIGGSLGKALLEKGLAEEVVGVCRRQSSLDRAVNSGVLTSGYVNDYPEATRGADIVVIATPVQAIKKVLKDLAEGLKGDVIVTDVGSTKGEIVSFAETFKGRYSFVGAHPLAGSEKTGVEYARADLFHGSLCILAETGSTNKEDLSKVRQLWESVGARVDVLSPEEHDEIIAFTSHLPHVVAYSLAGSQREDFVRFMSTGFKDTTRIASSDPVLWKGILLSNRKNVLKSVQKFRSVLDGIEKAIDKGDQETLEEMLSECKRVRDGLFHEK